MAQSKLRRNKQGFMEDEDERLKKEREKLLAKRSNSDVPNQEPQRNDWNQRPEAKEPAIEEPAAQEARVDKIQPIATEEEDGGIIPYSSDDSLGENLLKIPFNAIVDLPSHLVGWAEDIKYLVETGSDLLSDPKTAPEKIENKFNETVSSADEFIGTVVREFGPELAAEIGEDLLEDITDNPLDYMEWFIPGLAAKKGFKAVEGPKKLKGLTNYVRDKGSKIKEKARSKLAGPDPEISPEARADLKDVDRGAEGLEQAMDPDQGMKIFNRSRTNPINKHRPVIKPAERALEYATAGVKKEAKAEKTAIRQKDTVKFEALSFWKRLFGRGTSDQKKAERMTEGTTKYKRNEMQTAAKTAAKVGGGLTAAGLASKGVEELEDRYIKDPLRESIDEETEEQRKKFDRSRDLRTGHEARKEDIEKDKRRRIAKKGAKLTKD